ncbi:DUF6993 domain-containing protein [Sinomonas gamaensis]|uniref:DUF6993 domain-containing protein n=1 Tax=Sinomonas gamaensis TaxID=2565624 RepID=UPI003B82FCF5
MSGVKEEVRSSESVRPGRRRPRIVAWAVVVVLVLVSVGVIIFAGTKDLAGLAIGNTKPSAAAAPSASAAVTQAPSAPASALARFDPSGADEANLQLFKGQLTKAAHSASADSVTAKVLTDALIGAGFDAAAMQHSGDQTSAKLQAPTLTVSVRLQNSCLIGQFIRSDASVATELAAPIETGACLIGQSVPVK